MRFRKVVCRRGRIDGLPVRKVRGGLLIPVGRVRVGTLSLSAAGFLGCVVCLAWNVLQDRRPPEQPPARFGFGRPATQQEIDSEAIAIAPDGRGLPPGSGDAVTGARIYKLKCAACHGATGAEGPFQKLVGDTGKVKTIGNYWPYATTVFDYIRRAMPLTAPGTLNDADVYSLTAYLLAANKIIPPQTRLDASSLPAIVMPAKNLFVDGSR